MGLDLAVAPFKGEGTAVQRYSAARERSREDPQWARRVGFVEHHHNGRVVLRGTFAGHYLDVDESDRVSQRGAGEGAVGGALVGALLGPAGLAVGLTLGALIGSQAGGATDIEQEPQALADQLRAAVPRSSSAIVLIGDPSDADEMLSALDDPQGVLRRTLTADEASALEASLSAAPPAARGP